eukprot:4470128-Prymnesium_polylepis.1
MPCGQRRELWSHQVVPALAFSTGGSNNTPLALTIDCHVVRSHAAAQRVHHCDAALPAARGDLPRPLVQQALRLVQGVYCVRFHTRSMRETMRFRN